MRSLVPAVAVLLLSGCAVRGPCSGNRAAALVRPGDAERGSILDLHRGARPRAPSADPLPALARSDLGGEPPGLPWGARGAGAYAPRSAQRPTLLGRWRLAGDGDLELPLEGAWRMRVGLSAGGAPPDAALAEPGRRSETYLVPGVRLERDL